MIVGLIGPYPCPVSDDTLELSTTGKILTVNICSLNSLKSLPKEDILSSNLTEPIIMCGEVYTSRDGNSRPSDYTAWLNGTKMSAMAVCHGSSVGGGMLPRWIVHSILNHLAQNFEENKYKLPSDIVESVLDWFREKYVTACNYHQKALGSVGALCIFPVLGAGGWFGFGKRPEKLACLYFGCGDENLMVKLLKWSLSCE